MTARMFAFLLAAGALAGCGSAYKEKTAPCRRPANLTSYAPLPRPDCGPTASVNSNASSVLAAIDAMVVR